METVIVESESDANPRRKLKGNGFLSSPNYTQLLLCLERILAERLTKKQKLILLDLECNNYENITSFTESLSYQLKCSKSCIWNNLNSLKRCRLIENERDRPVKLSGLYMQIKSETIKPKIEKSSE